MKQAATNKGDGSQSFPARTSTLDPLAAYRDRCRPNIPTRADVELASSLIPRPNTNPLSRFGYQNTKRSVRTYEQPKYFLNVGPGLVSITKKLMAPKVKFWDDEGMTDDGPTRGRVKEWSQKSKNRMTQTLESLDYHPMFTGYAPAAMVTLSLPGQGWEELVPDIPSFKLLVKKLTDAYKYAWGEQIRAVWKMEFQSRGAPHLHMLMVPPVGVSRGRGVTAGKNFSSWLAIRWAQIVGASGTALRDHSLHGTHINFKEMSRYSDPRRIGSYFSKHGTFSEKDYQNQMPEHWQRAIAEGRSGGGNFWGYWGLEKAVSTVELTTREGSAYRQHRRDTPPQLAQARAFRPENDEENLITPHYVKSDFAERPPQDAVIVMRHLRKLAKSRSYVRKTAVERFSVDLRTGEVTSRTRMVNRRVQWLAGRQVGFLAVNDGPSTARDISRLLWDLSGETRATLELAA